MTGQDPRVASPGRGFAAAGLEPGGEILRALLAAVAGIRYGSVELIIHDGRLVQIERKEKMRFDNCESCPKK